MNTKFDIGERVYISADITNISIRNDGTERYEISDPHFSAVSIFKGEELKTFQELVREEKSTLYGVDKKLKEAWEKLSDIPVNDNGEIAEDFCPIPIFPKGTNREDIWRWFDAFYSTGVAGLMNLN